MVETYGREILLTIHILAVVVWLGFGFFELWLGRIVLSDPQSSTGAPLIRIIYQSDVVVFIATLIVFGSGLLQTALFGWGWFATLWLGAKQAIMITVLVSVALILRRALGLGTLIEAMPPGPGPASEEVITAYRQLEPWYWFMRILGLVGLVSAVWKFP